MENVETVALALQGGGVHGAFAWGVLDRMLEDGTAIDRVCGVSSGALLATMLVQGLTKGGAAGARREMRRLWTLIGQTHLLSPLQAGPVERWLYGWDLSNSMAWQGIETALRLYSPSQLNPFGHNPLRAIVDTLLDPAALCAPGAIPLTIAATDVESGRSRHWTNADVTTDVLLASCCLPFVFPAVRIDGRAYWDGGYSGNPPLGPLLAPALPDRLVLIRAQAVHRPGVPDTPAAIMNRLNELACHGILEAEMAALPAALGLTVVDADAALAALPISSKFNADPGLLDQLFKAGRAAALLKVCRAEAPRHPSDAAAATGAAAD